MAVLNITLFALTIFSFTMLFVPTEKLIKKTLDLQVNRALVPLLSILGTAGLLTSQTGPIGVAYILLSAFCVWALALGFLVSRKYIYTLALAFLIFTPFFLIAKLDKIAEYFAILSYFCLVLGVLKDTLYHKIINGENDG